MHLQANRNALFAGNLEKKEAREGWEGERRGGGARVVMYCERGSRKSSKEEESINGPVGMSMRLLQLA